MKMRKVISAFLVLVCICSVFGLCTLDIANAEGVRTVYATTSASVKQGSYGYLYVYLDDLTDLSALNVSVYYDAEKITVKSAYNQVSSVVNDIATGDGCVNASYIFDGKGSATKTNLFYIYYQVNSSAMIGDTYFDIVVTEAYSSTLEEMNFGGSRCALEIAESVVSKTCYIYSTSTLSTSVGEEFELAYRFSTYQIASGSISIQYDPELFEVVSVTNGSFLTDKIADINTALDGSVSISFVGTTYVSKYDIVTVRFKTLKNVDETSSIKFIVSELYDKDLNLYSCGGYTTKANIVFDETYTEDAPSMSVSASYNAQSDKVMATIKLESNSMLGAGDFVLKFDTNSLTFNSAQKGFFPSFFNINDKDVADGIFKFSIISLSDITDEQTVLTVVFDAKHGCQDATSNIEISGSGLTDSLVNPILLNFVDANVTIPFRHTEADTAVVENRVEPTCTANGSYDNVVYCTVCNEELERVTTTIPALGHTASTPVEENRVEADCVNTGSYDTVVYCSTCNEELERVTTTIPALGHTEGATVVENNVVPDCTNKGSYDNVVYCTVCNVELNRTTVVVDALGHSYSAVVTNPTCTEQGYTTHVCHCGDSYIENYVDALGHKEETIPAVEPTCTATGLTTGTKCSVCEEILKAQEEVASTGHDYVGEVTTEPTCTEKGTRTYTCKNDASHTYTEEIAILGHTEATPIEENRVEADCVNKGSYDTVVYCSTCNEELERVTTTISALGHTEGEIVVENNVAPDCTDKGFYDNVVYCTVCNVELDRDTIAVPALGHSYESVIVPPSCLDRGYTEHTCTTCGHWYQDSYIDATGHNYKETVIPPTCTQIGEIIYTCTGCGQIYNNYIEALGHDYISHEAKDPTCTEIGWYAYETCSRCDYTTYNERPARGHTEFIDSAVAPTCTTAGLTEGKHCSVCNEVFVAQETVQALGHDEISHEAKAPTCTEIGWYAYKTCARCEYSTYHEIPAKGHTEGSVVVENNVAPNCIEAGHYDNVVYCTVCNAELDRTTVVVDALGHDEISHEAKAPTCTEIGWYAYKTCARCEYSTYHEIPAKGHTGGSVVVENNVAPNCIEAGHYDNVVYCTVCNAELDRTTVVVDALGHDYISHEAKAPTCTEIGWHAYETCSRCDYTTYVERPAPGHNEVIDEAVAPDCENTGKTQGKHCSRCDEVFVAQEIVPALGHSYESVIVPPSCLYVGYTQHTCTTCGYWYQDSYIDATGHNYKETVTPPTCTQLGEIIYTCAGCGQNYNNYIAALDHDYISHEAKAPTCTEIGWYAYKTCSRCDYTTYVERPVRGHTNGSWITDIEPTCTQQGYKHQICATCGVTINSEFIPVAPHTQSAVVENNVEPTCTEKGSYDNVIYCTVCNLELHRETVVVPAYGHNEIYLQAQEPTCTKVGWYDYVKCCVCDYSTYQEIPATGHSYTAVVTQPTCTTQGFTTHTCHCGDTFVDNYIEPTGHTYDLGTVLWEPDCIQNGFIEFTCHCGYSYGEVIEKLGHNEVDHEAKAPTCEENGWEAYVTCTRCDYSTFQKISATGHDYKSVVTVPTCEAEGYTTYTCHCGDIYVSNYVEALGHSYSAWVETLAPTCTAVGEQRRDCANCDHYETKTVLALGHTEGATVVENNIAPTCTTSGSYQNVIYCAVCNAELDRDTVVVDLLGHSYGAVVTAPTCTEQGYTTYTCNRCQFAYEDNFVDATGHVWSWVIDKEATYTETGLKHQECAVCDAIQSVNTVIPVKTHEHNYTSEVTTEPTCTEKGVETFTCSICNDTYTQDIPALGHSYKSTVTVPTCTEKGYTTYTCTVCGDSYMADGVPALGHIEVVDSAVSPTCTTTGLTEGKHCSVCGKTLIQQDVVPALGHTAITDAAVAPDCENTGLTEGKHCDVCGEVLVTQTVVDALGHHETPHPPKAPTCTEIGWNEFVTCGRCDYTTYQEIPATGHSHTTVVTAPTCMEKGYTTHTCHCGDSYVDGYVDALGHTEGEIVVENNVAPDCTNKGSYDNVVYCTVCNTELGRDTIVVPATGHTDGQWVTDSNPTCTTAGSKHQVCATCGETIATDTIDALGHTSSTPVEENRVEADCVNTGSYDTVVYCSTCNEELERVTTTIPALGHTEGEIVVENNVAPDCTNKGSYDNVVYCTVCNVELNRTTVGVDELGHSFTNYVSNNNATCTEDGTKTSKCDRCDVKDTVVDTDSKLGHNYNAVVTAPTCTEQGYTTYTCARCSDTYVDNYVDALGHTEGEIVVENNVAPTCTADGSYDNVTYCKGCNAEISREKVTVPAAGHTQSPFVVENDIAATCTEDGSYDIVIYCSVCDAEISRIKETISATGHTVRVLVVENDIAPTCTADGSYDNVTRCGNCETELSRDTVVVPATGHSFDEWTVSTAPNCTEAGEERRDCNNCDQYETKELAALGHDYSDGGSCALCGKLSDGAVTGIVAGSAVAVGGGGFSLFWFVIRKKRFKK